jgi:hypothetical protein
MLEQSGKKTIAFLRHRQENDWANALNQASVVCPTSRSLLGLWIRRPLPRWNDRTDSLGGAVARHISLKFSKAGAGVCQCHMYLVLSEETEELHGYHCLGRFLQDSAHQLIQLLCGHCAISSQLRSTKRAGHGRPHAGSHGP